MDSEHTILEHATSRQCVQPPNGRLTVNKQTGRDTCVGSQAGRSSCSTPGHCGMSSNYPRQGAAS